MLRPTDVDVDGGCAPASMESAPNSMKLLAAVRRCFPSPSHYNYTGFRVDGTDPMMSFRWGSI